MTLAEVRVLNGSLNGGNTVLISAGWLLVRNEHKLAHMLCMCAAAIISLVLPMCYLVEHLPIGWDRAAESGALQTMYLAMVVSHRVLAFVIVPLVFATMVPAFGADWKIHRRLSKFTTPLWLYVSITGVLANL
jgi:uncharacterized membrane protein YozB (DUF420 family)